MDGTGRPSANWITTKARRECKEPGLAATCLMILRRLHNSAAHGSVTLLPQSRPTMRRAVARGSVIGKPESMVKNYRWPVAATGRPLHRGSANPQLPSLCHQVLLGAIQ